MSLIKCSECGKDISDKATACVHCGCPVPKTNPEQKNIDFADIFGGCFGGFGEATTQTEKKNKEQNNSDNANAIEIIKRYKPNIFMQFLASRRFFAVLVILFGVTGSCCAYGDYGYVGGIVIATVAILLPALLVKITYPMYHFKNYIRKNNLENIIRNDTGYMNVAVSAYNAFPSKKTLTYIKSLNMKAAHRIEQLLAKKN